MRKVDGDGICVTTGTEKLLVEVGGGIDSVIV